MTKQHLFLDQDRGYSKTTQTKSKLTNQTTDIFSMIFELFTFSSGMYPVCLTKGVRGAAAQPSFIVMAAEFLLVYLRQIVGQK